MNHEGTKGFLYIGGWGRRILLAYAAFSALWLLVSENVLARMGFSRELAVELSSAKFIVFVVVTTMVLAALLRRFNLEVEKSKAALAESEARYRNIFHSAPVSLWEEDFTGLKQALDDLKASGVEDVPDYIRKNPLFTMQAAASIKIKNVNQATLDLYGAKSKEELVGALDKILVPESYPVFEGQVLAFAEGKRVLHCEGWNATIKGELINVLVRVSFPPGPLGMANAIVCITDLTHRKQTEEALRRSEERYRSLIQDVLDSSTVGIVIADSTDKVVWVNEAMERLFGIPRDEFLGKVMGALAREGIKNLIEEGDLFLDCIEAAREGDENVNQEFRIKIKPGIHGVERWLEFWSQPIRSGLYAGGRIDHYYDVSDRNLADRKRKQLERQLLYAQKFESLGILAGGVAHDFNNLLTVVQANAEIAALRLPEDSTARANLQKIESATTKAAELVGQMLMFSGHGRRIVEAVDVSALIGDMEELLEAAAGANALVELDLEEWLPHIEADPAQVRQVVVNLVTNAGEAMKESGSILIRTLSAQAEDVQDQKGLFGGPLTPGAYVCVEVSDDGPGIDPESLPRVFDPFYTTKFIGRGLGLAAVLGIARAHKGAVWVDTVEGEGTTFRVFFPVPMI